MSDFPTEHSEQHVLNSVFDESTNSLKTTTGSGSSAGQVQGPVAHDAAATSINPVLEGGYASAAAPTDVSADGDAVRSWYLRNGAQATVVTAAGALVGGDATNGLDVDVTRIIPGTSATHLGKAVDSAAGATDTGVASLFMRKDTPATLTPADGDYTRGMVDSMGLRWGREYYAPVYEDNTLGKAVVEHRYTPSYKVTADTLVKSGAGLIHTATFTCNDAAPTAGSIIIYDNTAESGSELFNHTFTTTPFMPFTIILNQSFSTGLYVGFTTTNDVNVFLSYR